MSKANKNSQSVRSVVSNDATGADTHVPSSFLNQLSANIPSNTNPSANSTEPLANSRKLSAVDSGSLVAGYDWDDITLVSDYDQLTSLAASYDLSKLASIAQRTSDAEFERQLLEAKEAGHEYFGVWASGDVQIIDQDGE